MLNESDLKMIGVTKLGHRKKIIKDIQTHIEDPSEQDSLKINLSPILNKRNSTDFIESSQKTSSRNKLNEDYQVGDYGLSPRSSKTNLPTLAEIDEVKEGENSQQKEDYDYGDSKNIFSDDDYENEDLPQHQDSSEIWVKVFYKNECRVLRINKNSEIAEIEKRFAKEFKKRIKFSLKYKDNEGDLISITKQSDLEYAIQNSQGIIKLHLY